MQRCNFHTHTKYSDGTDTPQEMIEAAIGFGFKALGFSDHSYTHQREDYPMSIEGQKQYRRAKQDHTIGPGCADVRKQEQQDHNCIKYDCRQFSEPLSAVYYIFFLDHNQATDAHGNHHIQIFA